MDDATVLGHKHCLFIYFTNCALPSMLATKMAWLGFFPTPMSQPGIELTSVQLHLFWGPLIQDGLPAEQPWPWPGHELTMVAGVEAADDRWVDLWRTSDGHAIGSRQVGARPDGDGQVRPSDVQGCEVQPWRNLNITQLWALYWLLVLPWVNLGSIWWLGKDMHLNFLMPT